MYFLMYELAEPIVAGSIIQRIAIVVGRASQLAALCKVVDDSHGDDNDV